MGSAHEWFAEINGIGIAWAQWFGQTAEPLWYSLSWHWAHVSAEVPIVSYGRQDKTIAIQSLPQCVPVELVESH